VKYRLTYTERAIKDIRKIEQNIKNSRVQSPRNVLILLKA